MNVILFITLCVRIFPFIKMKANANSLNLQRHPALRVSNQAGSNTTIYIAFSPLGRYFVRIIIFDREEHFNTRKYVAPNVHKVRKNQSLNL